MTDQPHAIAGTCRICGCTEDRACLVDGKPCSWANPRVRTICNNPACLTAAFDEQIARGNYCTMRRPLAKAPQ